MSQHPESEELAAYLSHGLTKVGRGALEAHLAECRTCRQEVTSARRLLQAGTLRSRWPVLLPAAIAAVLALTLVGRSALAPSVERERVRGAAVTDETDKVPTIQMLSPPDNGTLARGSVRFAWVGQAGGPLYRLTLADGSGKALWVRDTPDTSLALPAAVVLSPGRTYFWYVDALDAGGRSLTTGTRRFAVRP